MSKKPELSTEITINGWHFKLDDDLYQCRGDVMYDDEHDEIPDPSLWRAAVKLAQILSKEGYDVCPSHSEKGWVEVHINLSKQ